MAQMLGKFTHTYSENLDEYFKAVGVPYIPRKLMCVSNPVIEIKKNDNDEWTMTTTTMFRTVSYTFKLGEEYEEIMPGVTIKSTTVIKDGKLVTECVNPDNTLITRIYEFSEEGLVLTYKHDKSGKEAVRHYKRT